MYLKGASLIENNFRNKCVSVGCPLNADLCQKRLNSLRENLGEHHERKSVCPLIGRQPSA